MPRIVPSSAGAQAAVSRAGAVGVGGRFAAGPVAQCRLGRNRARVRRLATTCLRSIFGTISAAADVRLLATGYLLLANLPASATAAAAAAYAAVVSLPMMGREDCDR